MDGLAEDHDTSQVLYLNLNQSKTMGTDAYEDLRIILCLKML